MVQNWEENKVSFRAAWLNFIGCELGWKPWVNCQKTGIHAAYPQSDDSQSEKKYTSALHQIGNLVPGFFHDICIQSNEDVEGIAFLKSGREDLGITLLTAMTKTGVRYPEKIHEARLSNVNGFYNQFDPHKPSILTWDDDVNQKGQTDRHLQIFYRGVSVAKNANMLVSEPDFSFLQAGHRDAGVKGIISIRVLGKLVPMKDMTALRHAEIFGIALVRQAQQCRYNVAAALKDADDAVGGRPEYLTKNNHAEPLERSPRRLSWPLSFGVKHFAKG